MNINLHIERLVLEGLPLHRSERGIVEAAVMAELTNLLTTSGTPETWQENIIVPHVNAAEMQLHQPSTPNQIGQQIAQSVYAGFSTGWSEARTKQE